MTAAEPGAVAPEPASIVFVTLQSGAHDDVDVHSPAPLVNVLSMACTSTSAAHACAEALASTTNAPTTAIQLI
jgi:hypothetical protein